jgi:hypothetical protein
MRVPKSSRASIIPALILANLDEPDEAACAPSSDHECPGPGFAAEVFVVLFVVGFPPVLPIRRYLGEPGPEMEAAKLGMRNLLV